MSGFRRKLMSMCGNEGDLPPGAIPCEMIYTDGYNGFIDTGITPTRSMSFDMEITPVLPDGAIYAFPFGLSINDVRYYIAFRKNSPFDVGYGNYYSGTAIPFTSYIAPYQTIRVSITDNSTSMSIWDNNNIILSETISYDATATVLPDVTMALLGRKTSTSSIEMGSWRGGLGRVKVYNDDIFGNLIADYIPCYYNGSFGMWDKVSNSFKGGSSLIYGFGEAWNTQGFLPNVYLRASGNLVDEREACVSPFFAVPNGCTRIRWNAGSVNSKYWLEEFNINHGCIDYWEYNTGDREININKNTKYIRFTMYNVYKDTCYLYDVTNNQYIWKGINV
jgi:hypothetical protein